MVKVYEGPPQIGVLIAGFLETSGIPHEGPPPQGRHGAASAQRVSILVPEESAETARTLIGSAAGALSETEEDDRGGSNEEVLRSIRREVAADDPLLRYIAGKARQTVWLPLFVLLFASYLAFPVARRYSEAIEDGHSPLSSRSRWLRPISGF